MTEVSIAQGKLKGNQHPDHQSFLGIPFAAAPVGLSRFCPAGDAAPWKGMLNAQQFAASALQTEHMIPGFAATGLCDEDCLYLNVYTPSADNGTRPVMVWIHGGSFTHGSGSEPLYNGGHLAKRNDVIVVTIHYRLGALGFACFGEESYTWGASPNNALLDQIAALSWVRDNIAYFGGNPDNVTVFGESAGADIVACLLAMPKAKGLFHKAIMQSGAGQATTMESAVDIGEKMLGDMSCKAEDHDAITALSGDQILAASGELRFEPVCHDGSLPLHPDIANAEGLSRDIPLLIGTNRDEEKLFNVIPDRPLIDDGDLLNIISSLLSITRGEALDLVDGFRESRNSHNLPHSNTDLLDAIQTVTGPRLAADQFALNHCSYQPNTFVYLFNWESPARRGEFGACHAVEMPFVFGSLDAPFQDRFAGKGPEAEALSGHMMDAWSEFARTGSPGHPGIGDWPSFNSKNRSTMIFDRSCGAAPDPFGNERGLIEIHR